MGHRSAAVGPRNCAGFGPRTFQYLLISRVLPFHQIFDDRKQPLALNLDRTISQRRLRRSGNIPLRIRLAALPGFRADRQILFRLLSDFSISRSLSAYPDGSSTNCANSTARHAASGRRAHHRCSVEGCPCRIDFSRAEAALIASSGMAISMSFFLYVMCAYVTSFLK